MKNNIAQGWKTSILGLILLLVDLYYLIEKGGSALIFFGLLIISLGLFFAPDDLIKGIRNLIKNNQDKKF